MQPGSKRKGGRSKGDVSTSDATADEVIYPVVSCSDSEVESVDAGVKRRKPGSPKMKAVAAEKVDVTEVVSVGEFVSADDTPRERKKKKGKKAVEGGVVAMKAITDELTGIVLSGMVDAGVARRILQQSSKYEVLLMTLLAENERLKGRLEASGSVAAPVFAVPKVPVKVAAAAPAPIVEVPPPVVPKPVETWSVVVKGGKGVAEEKVVEKVVNEVGPTMGVRVHEIRPIRGGGAVIRTPSLAEREKLAANEKFKEVGLEVSVNQKLGPKVVVQRVHAEITPDEFMRELYALNFEHKMTPEAFKKSVRLVSAPWKTTGGPVNVVLEGCDEAMQLLLDNGRCYIKWFGFQVRPQDVIPNCYRCLGFDHMIRDCRLKEVVCRRCGQVGHGMVRCPNQINCRNCEFKGLPAGHFMMSDSCPVYRSLVARVNARH